MKLVGGQQLNWASGDHSLYVQLFDRLPREIRSRGDALRFVGYESRQKEGGSVRFLGVEVESFDHNIPAGMFGWELTDTRWTIWRDNQGDLAADWQEDIRWLWRSGRDSGTTGEFSAYGPGGWGRNGMPRDMLMVANAHFPAGGGGPRDDVQLVDYDPSWLCQYSEMAEWLHSELGETIAMRVEHYGSTAIEGMPAKPVVDILVEIPSFQAAKKRAIPLMNGREWEYWWYSGHMVFIKRREYMGRRTHHIHLAPREHEIWKGLAFRDYLKSHPDEARRYADLKRHLAAAHQHDREAYTDAKSAFVTGITTKALSGLKNG